ncbi:MAG: LysM peptidoglycan-binding domain-containing protein, partial [Opitutus sp.]|nr:LysM peptidoglycan-binding domain-containing protein [Opitutus sp.]
ARRAKLWPDRAFECGTGRQLTKNPQKSGKIRRRRSRSLRQHQLCRTQLTLTPRPSGVSASLVTSVSGAQRSVTTGGRYEGAASRFHVVAGGDTLAKISMQYYGNPGRWGDILAANRDILGESNNLVVGRTLRIP